jgi:hypothetical protein
LKEVEVVEIIRRHVERKFPMACSSCGHRFASLKEYLEYTTPLGNPISYDAQAGNWRPREPVGTLAFANCRCGTTLSIGSEGMGLLTMWRLLRWARKESSARGIRVGELLQGIRRRIDQQVLNETKPGKKARAGR